MLWLLFLILTHWLLFSRWWIQKLQRKRSQNSTAGPDGTERAKVLGALVSITALAVEPQCGPTSRPRSCFTACVQQHLTSDTLLKHFTTKCCFDMKTSSFSHSAHLIKPPTLRGLINVPANFHKWRINYNWFHSLIHLLKWHTFIHVLTCLWGMSRLPHSLFKVSLSGFCYTEIISADSIHADRPLNSSHWSADETSL